MKQAVSRNVLRLLPSSVLLMLASCFAFLNTENGGDLFLLIFGFNFNGLKGIVSQKLQIFVTNVVRNSKSYLRYLGQSTEVT
jgi:hypothetical protein